LHVKSYCPRLRLADVLQLAAPHAASTPASQPGELIDLVSLLGALDDDTGPHFQLFSFMLLLLLLLLTFVCMYVRSRCGE
jgi:hypothetical protein